jgi:hypothetical protein
MTHRASELAAELLSYYEARAAQEQCSIFNFIGAPPLPLMVGSAHMVRVLLSEFSQHTVQRYRAFNLCPTNEGLTVFASDIDGGEPLAWFRTVAELDSWDF